MKAITYNKYGPPDVLQLWEVENPAHGDNDLLIRVHAHTVKSRGRQDSQLDYSTWFWLS